MKKLYAAVFAALVGVSMFATVACAAISSNDAVNLVKQSYPNANIYEVKYDHEDGVRVYEIKFTTDKIREGEIDVDVENGNIIKQDIEYYVNQ